MTESDNQQGSEQDHNKDYQPRLIALLQQGQTSAAYQWLLSQQQRYAQTPTFNEWLAALAGRLGHTAQQVAALERLTLLAPNHLGGQLDLALSYFQLGDFPAAERKAQQLQQLFATTQAPARAKQQLKQLQQALVRHQRQSAGRFLFKGSGQISAGFDSNANLGPRDEVINLELQGSIPFQLNLAPESIASSDQYLQSGVQLALQEQPEVSSDNCLLKDWCSTLVADISLRRYQDLSRQDQQRSLVGTTLTKRYQGGQRQWLGYVQHNQQPDTASDTSLSLRYLERWQLTQGNLAASLQWEHKTGNTALKGNLLRFSLSGEHQSGLGAGLSLSQWQRPERAAGDTRQLQASLNYRQRFGRSHNLTTLAVNWQRDNAPYSFLLFGNKQRQQRELLVENRLRWPFTPHLVAELMGRYSVNSSNIPLLDSRRGELAFSIYYNW